MKNIYFLVLLLGSVFFARAQQVGSDTIPKKFNYYSGKGFEFRDNTGNKDFPCMEILREKI